MTTPEIELERGKITIVTGTSGCGKSTFAQVICGAVKADDRRPVIDKKIKVGYMSQDNCAFKTSIEKNLMLNAGRMKKDEAKRRCAFLMEVLHLNELEKDRGAQELSGGELARMALARLLMNDYDLLILDEPTTPMSRSNALITEQLIKQYCTESGCAVLLLTNNLFQARSIGDHCLFFDAGRLIEEGPVSKVLYEPESPFVKKFIDSYNF